MGCGGSMSKLIAGGAWLLAMTAACHAEPAGLHAGHDPIVLAAAAGVGTKTDCEARIQKLDASDAEGEERLFEKRRVIDACFEQYRSDKMITMLLQQCAKYEEQPVVKRQFAADCQLAAFGYANALQALRAEFRK